MSRRLFSLLKVARTYGVRTGLGAGRSIFNRRTATAVRWKLFGPNLSEIDRGSRALERGLGRALASGSSLTRKAYLRSQGRVMGATYTPHPLTRPVFRKILAARRGAGAFGGLGAFRGAGRGWRRLLKGRF